MTSLEGKVALVTGAASGIGLAIARDFAAQGIRVTLSDIDGESGQAAASALPGARFQAADITDSNALQQLVQEVIGEEGQIDILVNNAGIQHVAPITEFPAPSLVAPRSLIVAGQRTKLLLHGEDGPCRSQANIAGA